VHSNAKPSAQANCLKIVLESKHLTLHSISQKSASVYGRSSPYYIPHHLYSDLRRGFFSPSLYQLCALSRLSGYELADWLRVFGFDLEDMPRLQILVPAKRTVLLDSSLERPESLIPWFRDVSGNIPYEGIVPMGQLIAHSSPRSLESLLTAGDQHFLYVKIGRHDALAFPTLLPGSIVRVDTAVKERTPIAGYSCQSKKIFLIERGKRLWCSRLNFLGKNRIVPISEALPFPTAELSVPDDARIIGTADMEVRRLGRIEQPEVPADRADSWKMEYASQINVGLGRLLQRARLQAGLSLRDASVLSRQIADELGDDRFFAAPGSLSDYEAQDTCPRHVHKVITLCLLYAVQLSEFLEAAGINGDALGKERIPGRLLIRSGPNAKDGVVRASNVQANDSLLRHLIREFEGLPVFLRGSLKEITGIRDISLRDFFWTGAEKNPLHPYLRGSLLVVVNRRKKTPSNFRSKPLCQQPLYVMLRRDGGYFCACCSRDGGQLSVHPYPMSSYHLPGLQNRQDVEVAGEVVTIVRRL
jgi:transcriptional regulator with XRE-family HTH domain